MHHDFFAWVRLIALIILILFFAFLGINSEPQYTPDQPAAFETEKKEPIYVTQAESLEIIPLKTEAAPEPTISDPTEETTPATEAATIATEPPTETVAEETTITTEPPTEPETEPTETEPTYTAEELEMLALVIYQESGADWCSDDTRLMVGTVVMNRIEDPRFPDTMYEVVTEELAYGRLHWTGIVWPSRARRPAEAHAVERAYAIAERILQGERTLPEDVIYQSEHIMGEIVAYSDGLYFCR